MSIEIRISIGELRYPGVAEALNALLQSIGSARSASLPPTFGKEISSKSPGQPMAHGTGDQESWGVFYQTLKGQPKRFVDKILADHMAGLGPVSLLDMRKHLGIPRGAAGKKIGGIIGSMKRWAPVYGVHHFPIVATKEDGVRHWRWAPQGS